MSDEKARPTTPKFNAQTPTELREARSESRAAAAEIAGRAYDVGKRADAHYQKHRAQWVQREYGELITKQNLSPELRPNGHEGRKLTSEADRNVTMRHSIRQARIALAQRNMIKGLERDDGRGR